MLYFLPILLSAASVALIFKSFQTSTNFFQQVTILLLVVIILFHRKLSNLNLGSLSYLVITYLCTLFVELLVLSTGGLYSSFLILLHLTALGIGFLISANASIFFVLTSLGLVGYYTYITPQLKQVFIQDPWTAVLYITSFLVIVPLTQFVARNYFVKDALTKALGDYLHIAQSREKSILKGMQELVVVIDPDYKVIDISDLLEKELGDEPLKLKDKNFFDLHLLTDKSGNPSSSKSLSLDNILSDKSSRIIDDLYFRSTIQNRQMPVSVQIRPVSDLQGKINQIVIVIIEKYNPTNQKFHTDIDKTRIKEKILSEEIKKQLTDANLPNIYSNVELLKNIAEDINLFQELEDHVFIKPKIVLTDVAVLSKQTLAQVNDLAAALGVKLEFELPAEEVEEQSYMHLLETQPQMVAHMISDFSSPVDPKMFGLLIVKILDVAVLFARGSKEPKVKMKICQNYDKSGLEIYITSSGSISNQQVFLNNLFEVYYGQDKEVMEKLGGGSWLEGVIIKKLAQHQNISIEKSFIDNPSALQFKLNLSRGLNADT